MSARPRNAGALQSACVKGVCLCTGSRVCKRTARSTRSAACVCASLRLSPPRRRPLRSGDRTTPVPCAPRPAPGSSRALRRNAHSRASPKGVGHCLSPHVLVTLLDSCPPPSPQQPVLGRGTAVLSETSRATQAAHRCTLSSTRGAASSLPPRAELSGPLAARWCGPTSSWRVRARLLFPLLPSDKLALTESAYVYSFLSCDARNFRQLRRVSKACEFRKSPHVTYPGSQVRYLDSRSSAHPSTQNHGREASWTGGHRDTLVVYVGKREP